MVVFVLASAMVVFVLASVHELCLWVVTHCRQRRRTCHV